MRILAERLGVREDAIRDEFRRLGHRQEARRPPRSPTSTPVPEARGRAAAEELLLHLLVADAHVRASVRGSVVPEMFRAPGHRELAEALLAPGAAGDDVGRLRERLRDETAVSLLSRFLIAEPPVKGDPYKVAGGMRAEDQNERRGGANRAADGGPRRWRCGRATTRGRDRLAVELTRSSRTKRNDLGS